MVGETTSTSHVGAPRMYLSLMMSAWASATKTMSGCVACSSRITSSGAKTLLRAGVAANTERWQKTIFLQIFGESLQGLVAQITLLPSTRAAFWAFRVGFAKSGLKSWKTVSYSVLSRVLSVDFDVALGQVTTPRHAPAIAASPQVYLRQHFGGVHGA
jgi:hypothetical protein